MLLVIDGDDNQYIRWLRDNPKGFVLNTRRKPDDEYIVLHRAECYSISRYNVNAKAGGFTERSYIKVCSNSLKELRDWVKRNGRPDGSFSKECSICIK